MSALADLLADLSSGDESRAEAAVPSLVALGEEASTALMELSHSADADQRWWAIRTLAEIPQVRSEDLLPFLNDSVPEVRQAAALALIAHPDDCAIPGLIRALQDEDSMVAGLAGNALVKVGAASTPALITVLNEMPVSSQAARILALRALSELNDQRAIPSLMKVMDEESALLQYWAREGLERLGLNMVYMKPT